jgi:hypothetical protein
VSNNQNSSFESPHSFLEGNTQMAKVTAVSAPVLGLSALISKQAGDLKDGVGVANLPAAEAIETSGIEGLTVEAINKTRQFDTMMVHATMHATGNGAEAYFKNNKEAKSVSIVASIDGVASGSYEASVGGARNGINPQTKEPLVSYGASNAQFDFTGDGKGGEYGLIQKDIKARITSLF